MKKMPLRYNISSWEQLIGCMSNYSNFLHIHVRKIVNDRRLSGTVIEIHHDEFGPVFCYTVDGSGPLLASSDPLIYEMSTESILRELERFGFMITFDPVENLPEAQLEYLATVGQLGFDKIRILNVYTYASDGTKLTNPHVVVFNVQPNPGWLDNTYSASLDEYTHAVTQGTAVDLSTMSEAKRFRWDWLEHVASIQDILDENANAKR